jgi:hypothetical protein
MPEANFVAWKRWVGQVARSIGCPLSDRQLKAVLPAVLLRLAAEGEPLPMHPDPTGETAVRNVLLDLIPA